LLVPELMRFQIKVPVACRIRAMVRMGYHVPWDIRRLVLIEHTKPSPPGAALRGCVSGAPTPDARPLLREAN